MPRKIRIGDLLVKNKILTQEQVDAAIAQQHKAGGKLGKILVDMQLIAEDALLDFLSQQLKIPFVDLKGYEFSVNLVRLLPESYARRFRAIVLSKEAGSLQVGMVDPLDIFAFDELSRVLNSNIQLALVREADLLRSIDMFYRRTEEITEFAEELKDSITTPMVDLDQFISDEAAASAPVVKLLQSIFEDAIQTRASDIHIEPDEHILRIRQRVDGDLQEQIIKEKSIVSALTLRLKLISGLNIAEKRLPQDGRFNIKVRDRSIDVRISTMPVQYGESVVMRILDQSSVALDLVKAGMPEPILTKFRRVIRRPYGMVLVTGPTGSGKTTTLYSALTELNLAEKKIITVEDPVEYRLERINQVQVNEKIELDFARVLRTALRQDPDIILVGEIRDQETATIAMRAALTGHMVLATLHTNDAASSAIRLMDMGVEGYLVATALRAVLAQRLVRRVCESCVEPYMPSAEELAWIHAVGGDKFKTAEFVKTRGCSHCGHLGFQGRVGIFDLFELDSITMDALRRNDPAAFANQAEKYSKESSLTLNALKVAAQGQTTISEVLRVAGEFEDLPGVVS